DVPAPGFGQAEEPSAGKGFAACPHDDRAEQAPARLVLLRGQLAQQRGQVPPLLERKPPAEPPGQVAVRDERAGAGHLGQNRSRPNLQRGPVGLGRRAHRRHRIGAMTTTVLGHRVERREDPGFLTGAADYLEDVAGEGALHAVFVRSALAHARITGIDTSEAAAMPGVHSVLTGADLGLPPARAFGRQPALARPRLAVERVRYVGEPVAVVLADARALAVDAADAVVVDYDPLPAVVDPVAAAEDGAPI